PWALLTTTACRLGEQAVWEVIEKQWKKGELDSSWLIHHREAKGRIDIMDRPRTLRQLREVYGAAMDDETGWMVPERIYSDMLGPTICRGAQEAAGYCLGRSESGPDAWLAKGVHQQRTRPGVVALGTPIPLGFDGSITGDEPLLRGCRVPGG